MRGVLREYETRMWEGQLQVLSGGTRWRKGEMANCLWCGKQYPRLAVPDRKSKKNRRFCSMVCCMEERHTRALKRHGYKECVICGGLFKNLEHPERYKTCGHPRCKFLLSSRRRKEFHDKRRAAA